MSKTITLLVGPPGSGKSTHAARYITAHNNRPNLVYINQDSQGKHEHMDLFNDAIENGHDIIVDRMNFNLDQRNRYLGPAKLEGYTTRIIVLHVPMETCIERCNARQNHETIKDAETAEKVIRFFFRMYERVQDHEADEVMREGWVAKGSKQAIICDLDGTLCNIDHRLHYLRTEGRKPHWKGFFDDMGEDTVNEWCREILKRLNNTYDVIYATGRPESHMNITNSWLLHNNLDFQNHLFSRPDKDHRKDDIIKEIILEFEIKTRYDILMVIDDRQQVVDMWRKHGYTVLQCAPGNF